MSRPVIITCAPTGGIYTPTVFGQGKDHRRDAGVEVAASWAQAHVHILAYRSGVR